MNLTARRWLEVIRFELNSQLRRWPIWFFLALFMFPLVGVTKDRLADALDGSTLFNAPLALAEHTLLFGVVALLILAAVAGDAASRDVQARMEPLMHSTPIGRAPYIGGRFIGAFIVAAILLTVVPVVQVLAGVFHPGVAAEFIAPFRPAAYLQAYFLVLLPNAFIATALMFALATLVRHSLGSYAVAALLFVGLQVTVDVVAERLGHWDLATLLDPTGWIAIDVMRRSWSPVELDERLIGSNGLLLWNRLLWLALAVAALVATGRRFRFGGYAGAVRWWKRGRLRAALPRPAIGFGDGAEFVDASTVPRSVPVAVPIGLRLFDGATRVRQTLAIARDSLREVVTVWSWILVPIVAVKIMANLAAIRGMGAGTRVLPTTSRILAPSDDLAPPLVLAALMFPVLVAGELVWRERDANLQALADSAPVSDGVRFIGKLLGLWIVLIALHAMLILAGMISQAWLGWYDFDPALYFQVVFGVRLAGPLLFALFAMSVHVMVNQKHVGHLIVLAVVFASIALAEQFGVEHPLLRLGFAPSWQYSSMSGFEPYVRPLFWFKLYWAAWTLVVALVARLFWVHGVERGVRERVRVARSRFTARAAGAIAVALCAALVVGAFIFYNTNILNHYESNAESVRRLVDYEQKYARYRSAPRPLVTRTVLEVELHPDRREAEVRGSYLLVNRTARPIDTLHVAVSQSVATDEIELSRPARAALVDDALGYRIHVLSEPLQPGDSLTMRWRVRYHPRGFPAGDINTDVVGNGSFIVMTNWIPRLGYQSGRELTDAGLRREHGLPARAAIPSLYDLQARNDASGKDRFQLEVTIGTAAGQTAVAPGMLRASWNADGRSYLQYATEVPIGQEFAIFSANYAVRRSYAGDVAIEVFHNREYDGNVDRVIRGMQMSISQLDERFGTYPYKVLRFVEYPSTGGSLHAADATVWYQELFSLFDPDHEPRRIDLPFAVTAHEVAHQWWGSQGARVEGVALLSESLAWYSAMGVVEEQYGTGQLERLLRFFRESYLRPRARAGVPLLRASDSFLAYRKGPFAMYALREYVGQDRVDQALRRLRALYASGEPPFATTLDLYRELQAVTPDSLHYLLGDLFERNTFWELRTRRATVQQSAGGEWRVSLDVEARKVAVDTLGAETEIPMNDLIEIGAFAPPAAGEARGSPLHLAMHRVRTGLQTITFVVPQRPASAGIDPRHLLIDEQPSDNVADVTKRSPGETH